MSDLSWLSARPVAHRGLHDAAGGIIENTASAVRAAIAGNYAIEVDLQISGDGEAMVFHDSTLDRLTQESGPLVGRSAGSLREAAFKGTSDRMMSLPELLEMVDGKVALIIEVKSQWGNVGPLERRTAQVLKPYRGPAAVMSFDPRSLAAFVEFSPGLPRGIVAERFRGLDEWSQTTPWQRFVMRHLLHARASKPHFVAYDIHGLPSAAPLAARFLAGRPLLTWTVRSKADRRRAKLFANQMIFEGFRP